MEKFGAKLSDMASLGLPLEFDGGGSKKRKRDGDDHGYKNAYRDNLSQTLPYLKEDEKVEIVNQLVLSHGHSHRSAFASIRKDILSIMPKPQMVIHNLWPSTRLTNQCGDKVVIKPIMAPKLGFKQIPQQFWVPVEGPDRIPDEVGGKIENHWYALSEGVTSEENLDYCYYKHLRFHWLNLVKQNVWSRTIDNAMPFLLEDFGENMMDALKGRFEFGKEYKCKDFQAFLDAYFGIVVDVIFSIGEKGRYFKEVRILFDATMSNYMNFNGTKLNRYETEDSFIFESIYTSRTDVLRLLMHGSDGARMYNIVFISSEASPYSNTGAQAEICHSLPISLAKLGHRVMVVTPRYQHGGPSDGRYSSADDTGCRLNVYCSGGFHQVSLFREYKDGVDWVFVDHPSYRRPGSPYCDANGDFVDNQFRFTLLCHAACEAPLVLSLRGITFGDKCLFFAIDCHAGLVPMLLAANYRPKGVYKDARTILVISNLVVQGVEPASNYNIWGLPPDYYGVVQCTPPGNYPPDANEFVNVLKGAMLTSDLISTVSEGYLMEILTDEGGHGLDDVLRSRLKTGITSGIDATKWNPSTDEHIHSHYSIDDLSGKVRCKVALQHELGLPCMLKCPLIGFIGRLDTQKGVDVLLSALPELLLNDIQVVMLGSGENEYEELMGRFESSFPDQFRGRVMPGCWEEEHEEWIAYAEPYLKKRSRGRCGFSSPISHRITAGCDILVIPSRVEPCGSDSLRAMRYGTVPVVHATGGLIDTVQNFSFDLEGRDEGTGWAFSPLTGQSMIQALTEAVTIYIGYEDYWDRLMKRGMEWNSSWDYTATKYETLFASVFSCVPYGLQDF